MSSINVVEGGIKAGEMMRHFLPSFEVVSSNPFLFIVCKRIFKLNLQVALRKLHITTISLAAIQFHCSTLTRTQKFSSVGVCQNKKKMWEKKKQMLRLEAQTSNV